MRWTLACLLLLFGACSVERGPSVTPPPPVSETTSSTTTRAVASTTSPTTTTTVGEACPAGDVMLADGGILDFDRSTSETSRIAEIDWRFSGECQSVIISFATEDGAPATTPPQITARILREAGVLRIETTASASVIVDQLVDQGLIERLFVPSFDGGHFIDLVLSQPAVARARILTSPARLQIDLQPGGPEVGRPLMTPSVVIVEPGSAAVAGAVLDISGYSIGEVGSLEIEVLFGEELVVEETLDLEASPNRWRAFELMIPVGGQAYDSLRITTPDDSVVAAIPFNQ